MTAAVLLEGISLKPEIYNSNIEVELANTNIVSIDTALGQHFIITYN